MLLILHKASGRTGRACGIALALLAACCAIPPAGAQVYPGGGGNMGGGMGGGMRGMGPPQPSTYGDESTAKPTEKTEKLAKKFFTAGAKSLAKAQEYEDAASKAPNEDKRATLHEKAEDFYTRALDQFTEAVRNDNNNLEAWSKVGYAQLKLGAYNESIDVYGHILGLKPDQLEAVEHRGEAYVATDRLDEAKAAYMDLYNHSRQLADQLMVVMEGWLEGHRASPNGVRAGDIDGFGKWVAEREGIAKQAAAGT